MGKIKAQLKHTGLWPDSRVADHQPTELTVAARRMAEATLAEFARLGVTVKLRDGRARFHAAWLSRDVRLLIETRGDLVEALLVEQARHGGAS